MSDPWGVETNRVRWNDRIQARLAGFSRAQDRVALAPWRRVAGDADQGRALLAGQVRLGDSRGVARPGTMLWEVDSPSPDFDADRHGFGWLDDLAEVGSAEAYGLARSWVSAWMTRFGHGHGPGWTVAQAVRRLGRVLDHGSWLSTGEGALSDDRLERFLARHRRFVIARFETMPQGLARFELCSTLIWTACALEMSERLLSAAQGALEYACRDQIGPNGGLANRCPEALGAVFCHLERASAALQEAGQPLRAQHRQSLARIAPCLRGLRHRDGGLARFHGGGHGNTVQIDTALSGTARTGLRTAARPMGFVRLARGMVSVIADCAAPPVGAGAGRFAHASTLAFEATSGRRPLIVNCGAGSRFGADWQHAARNTPSHSTLTLAGQSSSRFGPVRGAGDCLIEGPSDVQVDLRVDGLAAQVVAAHNGYAISHGLIHARRLDLNETGTELHGEDMLSAVTEIEKRRFADSQRDQTGGRGLPFAVRFHLHPGTRAALDPDLGEVRLTLEGGEEWVFRHRSTCTIRLDPSVYLEKTGAEPRATQQIVLNGLARRPETLVKWSLERDVLATPLLRDLRTDDPSTKTDQA